MTWLFFLLIVGGIAFYFTTPDERARALRMVRALAMAARDGGIRRRADQAPFFDALRERTRFPFVTIGLLLVNILLFFQMVFGQGAVSDPATLISWGANFGPRTSNGEWWRLLSATFLHAGGLELLISVACLAQLGFLLERLTGHTAFAVVYVSAGAFASIVSLSMVPVDPNVGSAGTLFGLYGLLLSAIFWGTLHPGTATIPWRVLKDFLPLAIVLVIYQAFNGSAGGWVELAGFTTGLVSGVVLTKGIGESKSGARRIAVVASTAIVAALACVLPLRGITDARPEVDRVMAAETRAADAYRVAVVRFNEGLVPSTALVRVIERQILPEIRATRGRLDALTGVPREHQAMVTAAKEYLRLREDSWRLRRDALQRTDMGTLRKADRREWESLEAFKRIRAT